MIIRLSGSPLLMQHLGMNMISQLINIFLQNIRRSPEHRGEIRSPLPVFLIETVT